MIQKCRLVVVSFIRVRLGPLLKLDLVKWLTVPLVYSRLLLGLLWLVLLKKHGTVTVLEGNNVVLDVFRGRLLALLRDHLNLREI